MRSTHRTVGHLPAIPGDPWAPCLYVWTSRPWAGSAPGFRRFLGPPYLWARLPPSDGRRHRVQTPSPLWGRPESGQDKAGGAGDRGSGLPGTVPAAPPAPLAPAAPAPGTKPGPRPPRRSSLPSNPARMLNGPAPPRAGPQVRGHSALALRRGPAHGHTAHARRLCPGTRPTCPSPARLPRTEHARRPPSRARPRGARSRCARPRPGWTPWAADAWGVRHVWLALSHVWSDVSPVRRLTSVSVLDRCAPVSSPMLNSFSVRLPLFSGDLCRRALQRRSCGGLLLQVHCPHQLSFRDASLDSLCSTSLGAGPFWIGCRARILYYWVLAFSCSLEWLWVTWEQWVDSLERPGVPTTWANPGRFPGGRAWARTGALSPTLAASRTWLETPGSFSRASPLTPCGASCRF